MSELLKIVLKEVEKWKADLLYSKNVGCSRLVTKVQLIKMT